MSREKNKIILTKNDERYFCYTNRLNSYLMLKPSESGRSDGFICNDKVIFTEFFVKINNKKYLLCDFDSTELFSDCFSVELKRLNLKIWCFVPVQKEIVIFKIENPDSVQLNFYLSKKREIIKSVQTNSDYFIFSTSEKEFSKEKLEAMVLENRRFWFDMENHLEFNTGNEFVSKALFWAQISGLKLCTGEEKNRGIWAGLPWFRDNWGRDTFIALPGILLVNGFFEEAKVVLSCFAKYQNKDKNSETYGRIPNRYRDDSDVIYNTADGNLWFIKALWQYLEYTGDRDFACKMWPVVKLAVTADLQKRCDNNGFLLNNDADTWMDARIEGREPLSPRGNRANDIQALWFDALNVYLKISEIVKDKDNIQTVAACVHKLKTNFEKMFWEGESKKLADRIREDDVPDFKIRPNQLFCVNSFYKLLSSEVEQKITKDSFEKLCLPFGVVSLSPEDEDFHPYHDRCKKYHKDAAYHNGAVWLWLSGPLVSALCKFGWQNTAWKLTKNHCEQILKNGCAGALSENASAALDRKGNFLQSGTWNQAWSNSEFVRNFYQDYLGVKPCLLENRIYFNPRIPHEWAAGNADIFAGKDCIKLSWTAEKDGKRDFTFERYPSSTEKIFVQYPLKNEKNQNKEAELGISDKVVITLEIEAADQDLSFAQLLPLNQYKCLKIKNYLFNKIRKEYKDKKISEVK